MNKISVLLQIVLFFCYVLSQSIVFGDSMNDDDQKYKLTEEIQTKREGLHFVVQILSRLDNELAESQRKTLMKRGGCLNFGGFPAGDCEFSDLNFNSEARKLLQPGGRHPGKK